MPARNYDPIKSAPENIRLTVADQVANGATAAAYTGAEPTETLIAKALANASQGAAASITTAQISDSGATGRSAVQATTPAALRTVAGAAAEDLSNSAAQAGLATYWQARARALLLTSPLRTVIPAGDSITQGSDIPDSYTSLSYWASGVFSSGRFRVLRNAGIGGNTSAALLARFSTDVIQHAPDVVLLCIGTNDYGSGGQPDAMYQTLFNNKEAMVKACLNAGILPVIVVPPPKNAAALESRRARIWDYLLADYYGLPIFDLYEILADFVTGQYGSGFSVDGTHPTELASATTAPLLAAFLGNLRAQVQRPYFGVFAETSASQLQNLVRNGSFNGVSTFAGWTINATDAVVTSSPAVYPATGRRFEYAKSAVGAAFPLQGSPAAVTAGNELWVSARVGVSGLVLPSASSMHLQLSWGSGGFSRPMGTWRQNGTFVVNTRVFVPSGNTSVTPTLFTDVIGNYMIENYTILNVTAARAIWSPAG